MSATRKTILLVEDEKIQALVGKKILAQLGYQIVVAETGERAVEIFTATAAIDLVLMDIDLGEGIDGTVAAGQILAARDVPVVFLSSHVEPEIVAKTEKITSYGYVVKNSSSTVLDASIKMAFKLFDEKEEKKAVTMELRQALEALQESETRFKALHNASFGGIAIHDQGLILDCNRGLSEMTGYALDELIGMDGLLLIAEKTRGMVVSNIRAGYEKPYAAIGVRKDGSEYPVRLEARNIPYQGKEVRVVEFRDVTESALREQDLVNQQQFLQAVLQASADGFWVTDIQQRFLQVNEAFCQLSGYTREEILQLRISDIAAADDLAKVQQVIKRIVERGPEIFTSGQRHKAGHIFDVEVSASFLNVAGGRLVGFCRDITERKRAERSIVALVAEKDLILKEVHHRLKNNMNTIVGVLHLQALEQDNPAVLAALEDAESRLKSMVVLYDKLYQSADFQEMSIAEYLPALVDEILGNFPGGQAVTVEKAVDGFIIGARQLQPLGIIVNELLTNIMKYAFTENSTPVIEVTAFMPKGHAVITVRDNGRGMPEAIDFKNTTGFGLMLVEMLTEQLGGSIRIERGNGTKIVLEFPI
jgi:PAS domain S-box-containing protein